MTSGESGDSDDGHLRVSDHERDDAVERLSAAATDGRLTLDEYSDRADRALAAVTRSDLSLLTHDLPPDPGDGQRPYGDSGSHENMVAIFGNDVRTGAWSVPDNLTATSVFGDCKIHLDQAFLHQQVTRINAVSVFGDVELFVPEGVRVRMTGVAIFGDKRSRAEGAARPGGPVIEVSCKALFGDVVVRAPGTEPRSRLRSWLLGRD